MDTKGCTNGLSQRSNVNVSPSLSMPLQPLQTLPSHLHLRALRQTSTSPLSSRSVLQTAPRRPPRQTPDLSLRGQMSVPLSSNLLCKKFSPTLEAT